MNVQLPEGNPVIHAMSPGETRQWRNSYRAYTRCYQRVGPDAVPAITIVTCPICKERTPSHVDG